MCKKFAFIIALTISFIGSVSLTFAQNTNDKKKGDATTTNKVEQPRSNKLKDFADQLRNKSGANQAHDNELSVLYRRARNPDKEGIALSVTTLLRSARAVISENQGLINDPNKGDKGFTGELVLREAKLNFNMLTGMKIDKIDHSTLKGKLLKAEMEAIVEVVNEAQEVINKKGVGYKNFLPAVFAFRVSQKFKTKMGKVAELKLTAPANYIRNPRNKPDKWEHDVIEKHFRDPNYPTGKPVTAMEEKDGKKAYRLIIPEYYKLSCLACHGEPKGATDITGGKKEGGKLGELGGAISVVIYD